MQETVVKYVLAVLVTFEIFLQMYEADFQDWGPPQSDFVDQTVNHVQLEAGIVEGDNHREMEQMADVNVCE